MVLQSIDEICSILLSQNLFSILLETGPQLFSKEPFSTVLIHKLQSENGCPWAQGWVGFQSLSGSSERNSDSALISSSPFCFLSKENSYDDQFLSVLLPGCLIKSILLFPKSPPPTKQKFILYSAARAILLKENWKMSLGCVKSSSDTTAPKD